MKIFIDTANLDEIRELNEWGVISGVTTNPSLIAKEGRDFTEVVKEITNIVNGPISGEVDPFLETAEEMVEQAQDIYSIDKNMVIKIPMTEQGLIACKILSNEDIPVNMTLIFTVEQALLAACAGARYVSPFIGRLDDAGEDGLYLIEQICNVFKQYKFDTEIIAASIRDVHHVRECALLGADIATIPPKIIREMVKHELTDAGIEKFKRDYVKVFEKNL